MALQGKMAHEDTIQPSLRCIPISNSKFPRSVLSDWIAPNAVLIGDISTKEGSSVWHGVTVRGDTARVELGRNSFI